MAVLWHAPAIRGMEQYIALYHCDGVVEVRHTGPASNPLMLAPNTITCVEELVITAPNGRYTRILQSAYHGAELGHGLLNRSRPELLLRPGLPLRLDDEQWVRLVAAQREYSVDWRFISLRLLNANVDYATHFPGTMRTATRRACGCCGSARGHGGVRHGRSSGCSTRHSAPGCSTRPATAVRVATFGTPINSLEQLLRDAGLPTDLADALDDTRSTT